MSEIETSGTELSEEYLLTFNSMTTTEKAAIVMFLLEQTGAAAVMKTLSPTQVTAVSRAMTRVSDVPQPIVVAVVDEFLESLQELTDLGLAGSGYVRSVLMEAVGESKAATVLAKVDPTARSSGLEMLDWMPPRAIADMVGDEHPQVIATILAMLDERTAADVLSYLSNENKASVVGRLATLDTISDSALHQLEEVMQTRFSESTSISAAQLGGLRVAAKIMDKTRSEDAVDIFELMRTADEDLVTAIEDNMFDFENLIGIDDKSMQTLIRSLDNELIVVALKGADDSVSDKFFACMSQRAAANIKDEMEALGPMRLTDVQEAQKQIIAVARQLADEGSIVLAGRGGDEYL